MAAGSAAATHRLVARPHDRCDPVILIIYSGAINCQRDPGREPVEPTADLMICPSPSYPLYRNGAANAVGTDLANSAVDVLVRVTVRVAVRVRLVVARVVVGLRVAVNLREVVGSTGRSARTGERRITSCASV